MKTLEELDTDVARLQSQINTLGRKLATGETMTEQPKTSEAKCPKCGSSPLSNRTGSCVGQVRCEKCGWEFPYPVGPSEAKHTPELLAACEKLVTLAEAQTVLIDTKWGTSRNIETIEQDGALPPEITEARAAIAAAPETASQRDQLLAVCEQIAERRFLVDDDADERDQMVAAAHAVVAAIARTRETSNSERLSGLPMRAWGWDGTEPPIKAKGNASEPTP